MGRGRQSRIDQLPADLKALLNRLLREGVSQRDIIARLEPLMAGIGERPLSPAGVNRYASKVHAFNKRTLEAREMADAWVAKVGELPTGDVGRFVIEILRVLALDVTLAAAEGGAGEIDPKLINDLALAVRRLESADAIGVRREKDMRAALADEARKAAKKAGLSDNTADNLYKALTRDPADA